MRAYISTTLRFTARHILFYILMRLGEIFTSPQNTNSPLILQAASEISLPPSVVAVVPYTFSLLKFP